MHLCTGLIKNVIALYNVNNSQVYSCFLDASKALDLVNQVTLFENLLQRNLSLLVTRALISWYIARNFVHPGIKSCLISFQLVTVSIRVESILFTVHINDLLYWSWRRMVLGVTGTSTSLVLSVMQIMYNSSSCSLP